MDSLPIELLDIIASQSSGVYYGLLGYKFFADTLNYNKQLDFMILFGHSIDITKHINGRTVYDIIIWYRNNKVHRKDGHAIEWDGNKYWYQNGELHRDNDLPAVEMTDGTKEWYQHGKRHRDNDLPAIEHYTGSQHWYVNGLRHRENDLPASLVVNGTTYWYYQDKIHRDNDLPAVIREDGTKEWYQNGQPNRDNGLPIIETVDGEKHYKDETYDRYPWVEFRCDSSKQPFDAKLRPK